MKTKTVNWIYIFLLFVLLICFSIVDFCFADENEPDEIVTVGEVGAKQWEETIVYHSNYPDSDDEIYTVKYLFKSSSNSVQYVFKSFEECGFETPSGANLIEKYWNTKKDGTGKSYSLKKFISDTSLDKETIHLYAQFNIETIIPEEFNVYYYVNDAVVETQTVSSGDSVTVMNYSTGALQLDYWRGQNGERYYSGDIINVDFDKHLYAVFKTQETAPDIPGKKEVIGIVKVKILCSSEPSEHKSIEYDLVNNTFELSEMYEDDNKYCITVTLTNVDRYIYEFDERYFSSHYHSGKTPGTVIYYDKSSGWKSNGYIEITVSANYFTVRYKDGVGGAVFNDIVYEKLLFNQNTPIPDVSFIREGYIFAGWDIDISDFVYADEVYTALWIKKETETTVTSKKQDTVTSKKPDKTTTVTTTIKEVTTDATTDFFPSTSEYSDIVSTDHLPVTVSVSNSQTSKHTSDVIPVTDSDNNSSVKIVSKKNYNFIWIIFVLLIIAFAIVAKIIVDKKK